MAEKLTRPTHPINYILRQPSRPGGFKNFKNFKFIRGYIDENGYIVDRWENGEGNWFEIHPLPKDGESTESVAEIQNKILESFEK